jgi:acyl-CoA oxidase
MLPVLHHITSGLKAMSSEMMTTGMDEMRQACGGAGYSLASGIASMYLGSTPVPTYEGVNVLMFQQSARGIIGQLKLLEQNKKPKGYFEYMNELSILLGLKCKATNIDEFLHHDNLTACLKVRSAYHIS